MHVSFVLTIVKERNGRMGECYNRRLLNRCRMGNTQIIGVAAFQGGIGNRKAKSNNSFCEKLHFCMVVIIHKKSVKQFPVR
jgi:hypothetical protein